MATKNLARTAIEGGRCSQYKTEVALRYAEERAGVRAFLHRAKADPAGTEDLAPPKRRPVWVCFSDKLKPVYRYLDAQCGRPWSKVRGELFSRFDVRTTPGRHVLFDHILSSVAEQPEVPAQRFRRAPQWSVDRHGILRRVKTEPRKRKPSRV